MSARSVGIRVLFLAGIALLAVAGGLVRPAAASAHFKSLSVVELEMGKGQVTGHVRLPYDMLALLPFPEVSTEEELVAQIRDYAADHMSVRGANGEAWEVKLSGGHTVQGNGVYELVFGVTITPPKGKVTDFSVTYDAIIERISSHRAVLTMRGEGGSGYQVLGFFESNQRTLEVKADAGSISHFEEFRSAINLGVKHISEGSDHLLFLMMLLLPAPLMVRNRRWVRSDDLKRSVIRVIHVVTAFAIGHSITLALAGLGVVHVPEPPIEALIALSILVAAVHVLRPLIPGGEAFIAGGFGLIHGLAFASLLGELNLESSALVYTLFGFNFGIELTQLLVVALIMPSLYLLSRTPVYTQFRIGGGIVGIVLAGSWFLQRTTLTPSDPFEFLTQWLIENPFVFVAALAVFCTSAYFLSSERAPLWGTKRATGQTA